MKTWTYENHETLTIIDSEYDEEVRIIRFLLTSEIGAVLYEVLISSYGYTYEDVSFHLFSGCDNFCPYSPTGSCTCDGRSEYTLKELVRQRTNLKECVDCLGIPQDVIDLMDPYTTDDAFTHRIIEKVYEYYRMKIADDVSMDWSRSRDYIDHIHISWTYDENARI